LSVRARADATPISHSRIFHINILCCCTMPISFSCL
jgi:hypothetical protein